MDSADNGEAYAPLPDFERSTGSDFQYTPPIEQSGLVEEALWLVNAVEGNVRKSHPKQADQLQRVWRILTALTADKARDEVLEEARAEERERCAKLAENFQHPVESSQRRWEDGRFRHAEKSQLVPTGHDIATAIRSLKGAAK